MIVSCLANAGFRWWMHSVCCSPEGEHPPAPCAPIPGRDGSGWLLAALTGTRPCRSSGHAAMHRTSSRNGTAACSVCAANTRFQFYPLLVLCTIITCMTPLGWSFALQANSSFMCFFLAILPAWSISTALWSQVIPLS